MSKRIDLYSVGELARAAGVSIRLLHHYDAIGLLPAGRSQNGYPLYDRAAALRLQEILFYRAAGMQLSEIAALPDAPRGRIERLETHRRRLSRELARKSAMLAHLDRMIAETRGESDMSLQDLYLPIAPEQQADYEAWLRETYGREMAQAIAASKAHLEAAPEGMAERMAQLQGIEAALLEEFNAGREPEAADCSDHNGWVARMWGRTCGGEAYAGLADLYLTHPDFVARYEALAPGFSQWLPAAMKAWARHG